MPEPDQPIDRPAVYRVLIGAFAVWALHFIVAYGAALIFPGQAIARWVAIAAMVLAIALLLMVARNYRRATGAVGMAAAGIAIAAIMLGTLPAILS